MISIFTGARGIGRGTPEEGRYIRETTGSSAGA